MLLTKVGILLSIVAGYLLATINPVDFVTACAGLMTSAAGLVFAVQHFLQYLDARRRGQSGPPASGNDFRLPGFALAGVALAVGTIVAGCNATPKGRVVLARQTYTAALNVASDLRESGRVTDDQAARIEAARVAAPRYLDAAEATVNTGGTVSDQIWLALGSALDALNAQVAAGTKAPGNGPTTNPSTRQSRGGYDGVPDVAAAYPAIGGSRPDPGRVCVRAGVAVRRGVTLGRAAA